MPPERQTVKGLLEKRTMWAWLLLTLLWILSLFLMVVILIQRGRGGGLAGAFGGLGGQSAFGTKAGDVFTVITIVTAVLWVILACGAGAVLRHDAAPSSFYNNPSDITTSVELAPPDMKAGDKKAGAKDDEESLALPEFEKETGNEKAPSGDKGAKPAAEGKSEPQPGPETKPEN